VNGREIRQQVIDNGTCTDQTVPSVRTINRIVQRDIGMSRKIVQSVPTETETARHDQVINNYLAEIMNYRPQQIHFFDECSVIKTALITGKPKIWTFTDECGCRSTTLC
jgi:hypothetical protein